MLLHILSIPDIFYCVLVFKLSMYLFYHLGKEFPNMRYFRNLELNQSICCSRFWLRWSVNYSQTYHHRNVVNMQFSFSLYSQWDSLMSARQQQLHRCTYQGTLPLMYRELWVISSSRLQLKHSDSLSHLLLHNQGKYTGLLTFWFAHLCTHLLTCIYSLTWQIVAIVVHLNHSCLQLIRLILFFHTFTILSTVYSVRLAACRIYM